MSLCAGPSVPGARIPARCAPGAVRPALHCTVVLDREDDVRFTRTALASHSPAAGRIVVHPAVAPSDRLLWHDILQTLGTRHAARASREEQERAVRTALNAAGPCQVTVLRAHRLGPSLWADLVHLHRTTRADLVLVHHAELPDRLAHLLRHRDHRIVDTFTAMAQLHPPAPQFPTPRPAGSGFGPPSGPRLMPGPTRRARGRRLHPDALQDRRQGCSGLSPDAASWCRREASRRPPSCNDTTIRCFIA